MTTEHEHADSSEVIEDSTWRDLFLILLAAAVALFAVQLLIGTVSTLRHARHKRQAFSLQMIAASNTNAGVSPKGGNLQSDEPSAPDKPPENAPDKMPCSEISNPVEAIACLPILILVAVAKAGGQAIGGVVDGIAQALEWIFICVALPILLILLAILLYLLSTWLESRESKCKKKRKKRWWEKLLCVWITILKWVCIVLAIACVIAAIVILILCIIGVI